MSYIPGRLQSLLEFLIEALFGFIKGVAGEKSLNQADLIHPNPEGVNVIVKNILPFVEALIKRISINQRK